jgi:intein-encoded DNA endonuclease-like protein
MPTNRKRKRAPAPSKLDPHTADILEWTQAGLSSRQIRDRLEERHGVKCSHTTVGDWLSRPANVATIERVRREQIKALERQTISAGSQVMAKMLQLVMAPETRDSDRVAAGALIMRSIGMDKALESMEAQGDLVASAVRETVAAKVESMRSRVTAPPQLAVVDAESVDTSETA